VDQGRLKAPYERRRKSTSTPHAGDIDDRRHFDFSDRAARRDRIDVCIMSVRTFSQSRRIANRQRADLQTRSAANSTAPRRSSLQRIRISDIDRPAPDLTPFAESSSRRYDLVALRAQIATLRPRPQNSSAIAAQCPCCAGHQRALSLQSEIHGPSVADAAAALMPQALVRLHLLPVASALERRGGR